MNKQRLIVSLALSGVVLGGSAAALACFVPIQATAFLACSGGSGATAHSADGFRYSSPLQIDANLIQGDFADSFGFNANTQVIQGCVAFDGTPGGGFGFSPPGACPGLAQHDLRASN